MKRAFFCSLLWIQACGFSDLGIFLPIRTDTYELPNNHIPRSQISEHRFDSTQRSHLVALWVTQTEPTAATILYLHGQGGHIDYYWDWVMRLWDLGYNIFIVDYRGYGKSSGKPDEQGLYDDADAALHYLEQSLQVPRDAIVTWGYSLGTGVASHLAAKTPTGAVVLEAPYTSMTRLVQGSAPYSVPADWLTSTEFNTISRVADIQAPIVIVHGTADRRIPYWMGRRVYNKAHEPKRFVSVSGAGHQEAFLHGSEETFGALQELAPNATP